ncbi:DUF2285 domain-containing protein [uncultured Tateyamaria sp.]|uniref:DNA -binding domain-containing protein n=1 Tax=uncultured Tateyamaria sp. TaxID=455651 RepID=UPI0026237332|nr:DUF2285 domain-containing protein [uncultured Tateyamaria sp.]
MWAQRRLLGEWMGNQNSFELAEAPPESDSLTDYDRAQLKLYARLLDAQADEAALSEIAHHLFGINAEDEPERAKRIHDSHLARAHWVAEQGYRDLLPKA